MPSADANNGTPVEDAIKALAESVASLNATAERLVAATAISLQSMLQPKIPKPRDYTLIRQDFEQGLERMIVFLDNLDGDENLEESDPREPVGDEEPELGATEVVDQGRSWRGQECGAAMDGEPTLGSTGCYNGTDHRSGWAQPTRTSLDEREAENEHGGDIQDEPHDDDDPGEEADTGIGDHGGLEEQAGRHLPYDEGLKNRAAAREALRAADDLSRRKGRGRLGGRSGICNVRVISL